MTWVSHDDDTMAYGALIRHRIHSITIMAYSTKVASVHKYSEESLMDIPTWNTFLTTWNTTVFTQFQAEVFSDVPHPPWLGRQPVDQQRIQALEKRLQVSIPLPPSYRSFLLVTNGWRLWSHLDWIFSIDEVRWYAQDHQDNIDAWNDPDERWDVPDEEYFVYGSAQRSTDLRVEYLPQTLYIGESVGGQFLLNPNIVTNDGEWETWYFSGGLPGAVRYRSFWDFMQSEYEGLIELLNDLAEES